jgi:hypothetical protein
MAVTKTIEIDGRPVTFRASAAIPRLYRNKFHRDIYRDLSELQKGIDEGDAENSRLDTFSLELFENIAWLMAKHADKDRAGHSGGMAGRVRHVLDLRDPPADHRAVGTQYGTAGDQLKKNGRRPSGK